jgi:ribosome-interacting GTPase 1
MPTEFEYLGNGNGDGTTVGKSATEKVSFHGVTPVVQAATIAAVATTGAAITSYGFTTAAQANAIVSNLNSIRTALIDKGIIASA